MYIPLVVNDHFLGWLMCLTLDGECIFSTVGRGFWWATRIPSGGGSKWGWRQMNSANVSTALALIGHVHTAAYINVWVPCVQLAGRYSVLICCYCTVVYSKWHVTTLRLPYTVLYSRLVRKLIDVLLIIGIGIHFLGWLVSGYHSHPTSLHYIIKSKDGGKIYKNDIRLTLTTALNSLTCWRMASFKLLRHTSSPAQGLKGRSATFRHCDFCELEWKFETCVFLSQSAHCATYLPPAPTNQDQL